MLQKLTDVATNINVSTAENSFIGANFYTEDDGSAYIRITIRDNNEVLDFNKTDMTPRLDLFSSDGSIFTNEPLEIIYLNTASFNIRCLTMSLNTQGK